jgi:hypothetical protein
MIAAIATMMATTASLFVRAAIAAAASSTATASAWVRYPAAWNHFVHI